MQITTTTSRKAKHAARSRAEWLQEVRQWRGSGQTAREYARAHGVHASTLTYWASRLRDEVELKRPHKGAFVAVGIGRGHKRPQSSQERLEPSAFEVVLSNGRRVRITGHFQAEALSRLLAVVEGGASC